MASREGAAAGRAPGIAPASPSAESETGASVFACLRVVRTSAGLRRGLGATTLEADSSVTPASTFAAGGTGVAAGAGARRAREAVVCRRGRGAAASGGTTVSFSGLVFLFISRCYVLVDAFFIVVTGIESDHPKF